jgi:hypothetical protein
MKKRLSATVAVLLAMALVVSGRTLTITQASSKWQPEIVAVEDLLQDEAFVANMEEQLLALHDEEYWENLGQARSNDAKLMASFADSGLNAFSKAARVADPQGNDESTYPEFIGGIYYNDDGNMVVQIVDNAASKASAQTKLEQVFSEEDGVIQEYVEFSYNEIRATMDTLNALYLSNNCPATFDNVDSFAEDTINNRIEVRLAIYNEEEITRFKETIFDSPTIGFVQSQGQFQNWACETTTTTPPPPPFTFNPGSRLNVPNGYVL